MYLHAHLVSLALKEFASNATLNVMVVSPAVPLVLIVLLDSSNADHHVAKHALLINLSKVLSIPVFHAILNAKLALLNNSVQHVLILKLFLSMEFVMTALIHAKLVEQLHLSAQPVFKDSV